MEKSTDGKKTFLIHSSQQKGDYLYSEWYGHSVKVVRRESLEALKRWLTSEFVAYIREAGFSHGDLQAITIYEIAHQETVNIEHFNAIFNNIIYQEAKEKEEQADRAEYERLKKRFIASRDRQRQYSKCRGPMVLPSNIEFPDVSTDRDWLMLLLLIGGEGYLYLKPYSEKIHNRDWNGWEKYNDLCSRIRN